MEGKAWKYKDNINTDIIAPPVSLELSLSEAVKYAMAPIDTEFASAAKEGDYFVAEHNCGSGSSRETAPLLLKEIGIRAVIAKDFARIFYRNCINIGLIAVECPETEKIAMGDVLDLDWREGTIRNLTRNETYPCTRIPPHIEKIISSGGLIPYIREERNNK